MSLKGLSEQEEKELIDPGTILLAYRGSIAHGMYMPSDDPNSVDDKDLIGCCVPEERFYFGLHNFEQQEIKKGPWDLVNYEVRKLVRLLVQQNPNVLSILWTDPKFFLRLEAGGRLLLKNRSVFVSRKAYHSFTGYAYAQMKRMTHNACQGYMGEKRKRLVEKFGFDTKNAAHLIRLLRMGIEYLNEGVLYVDRGLAGDAPYLLSIKRGEMPLEKVKEEAEILFRRAGEAYDRTKLPPGIDNEKAEKLAIQMVKMGLGLCK